MTWEMFNLEKQYTYYGSTHQHYANKAIHIVSLWLIVLTAFVLLAGVPAAIPQPAFVQSLPLHQYLQLNLALAAAVSCKSNASSPFAVLCEHRKWGGSDSALNNTLLCRPCC